MIRFWKLRELRWPTGTIGVLVPLTLFHILNAWQEGQLTPDELAEVFR